MLLRTPRKCKSPTLCRRKRDDAEWTFSKPCPSTQSEKRLHFNTPHSPSLLSLTVPASFFPTS